MSWPSDFARLAQLAVPPAAPVAARGDWSDIERDLGTPLPADWKALVEQFGEGSFCDFFNLFSPFFTPRTMMAEARATLAADNELVRDFGGRVPFPLYPSLGGALPWARTDNGDVAYWLTNGAPEDWPVAIWNARSAESEIIPGGAVRFLVRWLGGEARCPMFPDDADFTTGAPDMDVYFDRWIERTHFTLMLREAMPPPRGPDETLFAARLRTLFAALGAVTWRGAFGEPDAEKRQAHFVMEEGAWRITYDTLYGHTLRVGVPPDQVDVARARFTAAAEAMGLVVGEMRLGG